MKKSLRIITLLMALIMTMSVAASAAGTGSAQSTDSKYFEYTEKDGEITIKKYTGTDTVVVIPEKINGKPVTSIGSSAFKGNTSLREITIPATVGILHSETFKKCISLRKVTMLGETSIWDEAFAECCNLTSIRVNGVSIYGEAFKNCARLRSVEFGPRVFLCEEGAFNGCISLMEIKISEDNQWFEVIDGVLYNKKIQFSDDYKTQWEEKTPIFTLVKAESLPATKRTESSLPLVQVTYDKDGKVSTKTEYTYDVSGNLLKKSYYSYEVNPKTLCITRESTYTYDEKGNLLRENIGKRIDFEYQFVDNYGYKEYKYNSYGLLVEEVEHNGYTSDHYTETSYKYYYDKNGNTVKWICHETNVNSTLIETVRTDSWTVSTFDSKGNNLSYMHYKGAKAEEFYYGMKYEYDAAGNQIAERHYGSNGSVTRVITSEYDSNGNLVAVRNGEAGVLSSSYKYDSEGRRIESCSYDDFGNLYLRTIITRDAKGNIISAYAYEGSGKELMEGYSYTATYDEKGNQLTLQYLNGSRYEYTYDANGNMTSEIMYKPDDNSKVSSATYWTYDEYGNELSYKYINAAGEVVAHRENTYIYFD